jgi:MFS family permease
MTYFLLSQPLATLADGWNKKRVLVSVDFARAAALLGVAWLLHIGMAVPPAVYAANLLLAMGGQLFGPARAALLPDLLSSPERLLIQANAWFTLAGEAVALFGFPLGGVIVAVLHPDLAMVADAASFAISGAAIGWGIHAPAIHSGPQYGSESAQGVMRASLAGVRFIWRRPHLRALAVFAGMMNLVGAPLAVSTVVLSRMVLHAGLSGYGLLEGGFAAGGIAGAAVARWASKRLRVPQLVSIALLVPGISLATVPLVRLVPEAVFALGTVSLCTTAVNVPVVTLLQLSAPPNLRARVTSGMSWLTQTTQPIGLIVGAWLIDRVSPSAVYTFIGLLLALTGAASYLLRLVPEPEVPSL